MVKVSWFADDVIKQINKVTDVVSKEIANDVMVDAKKILKRKAKTTTEKGLLSQFSVEKSKFKNGGWTVWSQGPTNWHPPYHASFFEMGTFKDEAKPFMRPAAKKNQRTAKKKYHEALK